MDFPLLLADEKIPMIAITGGIFIGVVAIGFTFISKMHRQWRSSQLQREIAAYVAEGTMKPEEGERLIKAANDGDKACERS